MRQFHRMRRQISPKSNTCTEGEVVYAAGISAKVKASYPGRSVKLPCATGIVRCRDGLAEVSSGHNSRNDQPVKGQTCHLMRDGFSVGLEQMSRKRT